MITQPELDKIKEAFDNCTRPVIIFDNDHDGLSSFLMVYRHIKEGKGIPMKRSEMNEELARRINEYSPDLVIILDIPVLTQEFVDMIPARKIWIDHHPLVQLKDIEYYNPRKENPDDIRPVSYWIYKILQRDLWIAMCGTVGDWHMPEDSMRLEFCRKYPSLLPENIKDPGDALFTTKLGTLVDIMNLNLKGKVTDAMASVKTFTRIKDPYEILDQSSPGGAFLYKKYKKLDDEFQEIYRTVKIDPKDKMILFIMKTNSSSGTSFTTQISNKLLHEHPEKLILVAWEYEGEYKCSLRATKYVLPPIIKKALENMHGTGGGHDNSCGACVRIEDFERFVQNIRQQL